MQRMLPGDVTVQLGRSATGSILLRVANAALALATSVLLARLLGPEGYGIYAFAFSLVGLLSLPAQAGLPTLLVREVARYEVDGRWGLMVGLLRRSNQAVALVTLIIATGAVAFMSLTGVRPGSPSGATFIAALALLPLMALGNLRGAALRGLRKVVEGQLPEFLLRPGLFAALLGLALVTRHRRSLSGLELTPPVAMALHAAAALVAYLIGIWLLRRGMPKPAKAAAPEFDMPVWLHSVAPLTLLAGMQLVSNQMDIVLLGVLKPASEVGIYRVAWQVSLPVMFALTAVNLVAGPHFARAYHAGARDQLQRLATWSARVAVAAALPTAAVLILFGRPLLAYVFGDEFAAGGTALALLCVGQLCNAVAGSVGTVLNMTGHERDTVIGVGIAAATNLVLNLILIPLLGIEGAALATMTSMIVWNGILFTRVRRKLGIVTTAWVPRRARGKT